MPSIEYFFDSLLQQKSLLDNSPFLDANSQRGIESSYCLFHDVMKHSSRQTQNRHDKARQHLKNAFSIAKALFVLVAVTVSVSDLALLDHEELFPRLENWWQNHLPSQKFQSRAIELINELDHEKDKGKLIHVQRKSHSRPIKRYWHWLSSRKEQKAGYSGSREVSRTRGKKMSSLPRLEAVQLTDPPKFKIKASSQDLVASLWSLNFFYDALTYVL